MNMSSQSDFCLGRREGFVEDEYGRRGESRLDCSTGAKNFSRAGPFRWLLLALLFGMLCAASAHVWANTYAPTIFTDPSIAGGVNSTNGVITGGSGNGQVSLRSALKAADTLGGTHTVNLGTGTYVLDGSANYTIAAGTLPFRTLFLGNTAQNITINGNGPANTIISMAAAGRDRILTVNYDGTTNNVITTISGVKFKDGYLTYDTYGGAAIYAGPVPGNAETLTVTNCAFDNNIAPSSTPVAGSGGIGGAIYMFQGTLTVDNSTFTNNKSVDGDAGALYYVLYNQGDSGVLTVTNSTFSGNSAKGNGGAIEFTAQGGPTGGQTFTVNINRNTFSSNTATGYGGAISANNSMAGLVPAINFNRFVGNSSTTSATTSALLFVNSAGSVNANNNWWASNVGPGVGGTQQASGVGVAGAGALTANRWLQLKTTAATNPIVTNQTSALTAGFLSNNLNEGISSANLGAMVGVPVTWSSIGGSITGQQTTVQAAGSATATYNEITGVAGTHSATAVVDSTPASGSSNTIAFTVNKANVTTTITSDTPDPSVTGQGVVVAYSVAGSAGNSPTVPTGNVQVSDGVNSATGTVATGSASVALLTAGNRTLTATYQGDANFNASPASTGASHLVNKANTTATITSQSNATTVLGQSFTVNYAVAVTAPGVGTPTGNVVVSDGVDSATATAAAGLVNLTLNTPGIRTLTATYQGDTSFNASPASTGLTHTVNAPPTAYSAQTPPATGVAGTAYAGYNFAANGVPAPTYAVQSGALPGGLALSSAGVLSSTPTIAGVFSNIVVRATNVAGVLDTTPFTITISPTVTVNAGNIPSSSTSLVINGTGFSTTPGNNVVTLTGGVAGVVTAATNTQLTVPVSGLIGGDLLATVTTNLVSSGAAVKVASVLAPPTVTANAATLPINAATLTINGTNFDVTPGNNAVALSSGAGNVTAATPTQLTVTLTSPPTAPGSLTAIVTTPGGSSGAAVQVATVIPVVTSSIANLAANAPSIIINGLGFSTTAGQNTVTFNDGAVGTVSAATATQLTVNFSTKPASAGSLTASVTTNTFSSGAAVQVATVTPVVTSSPASIQSSAPTLTINGFGFASSNAFNSVVLSSGTGSVTTSTPTQLIFTFATAPSTGSLTAVVTSNSVSSGAAVQVANVVSLGITANTASLAQNASQLIISGVGFSTTVANNSVTLSSGTAVVTAATATQLTVSLGGTPSLGPLNATVSVSGVGSTGPTQVATIVAAPTVTLNPANLAQNAPTIVIAGTNFSTTPGNNTVVLSSGTATVTAATATQLTATLGGPPALGNLTAVVTSNGGSSGAPVQVATVVAAPTVTLNTANLAQNAPTIIIAGTNFSTTPGNNTVTLSSGTATVTAATATQLTATLGGPPALGSLTAVVTTNTVSSGAAVQVATIVAAPTVTLNTANLAQNAPTIVIAGTNFSTTPGNNTVVLSSGTATVTAATATQLTATLGGPPALGNLTAVVTSNGGSSGAAVQVATIVAAPVLVPVIPVPALRSLALIGLAMLLLGFGAHRVRRRN